MIEDDISGRYKQGRRTKEDDKLVQYDRSGRGELFKVQYSYIIPICVNHHHHYQRLTSQECNQ